MKHFLYISVLIIAAIILGGLIGDTCLGSETLNWLAYSKEFSFVPGTFINLDVFSLSFGISFSFNVSQLILIFIAIFTYYKTAPKLFSK